MVVVVEEVTVEVTASTVLVVEANCVSVAVTVVKLTESAGVERLRLLVAHIVVTGVAVVTTVDATVTAGIVVVAVTVVEGVGSERQEHAVESTLEPQICN